MRAAVLPAPEARLNIVDRDVPQPGPGEVLVKFCACGMCFSEVPLVHGGYPFAHYPVVPGYEVTGTVEVGTVVGAQFLYSSCGHCDYCVRGDQILLPISGATASCARRLATGTSRSPRPLLDSRMRVSIDLPSVPAYEVDGWTALGDRTRRTIFERIARRPCAVGELASGLPVSRPAVSQHLKVLKDAGLVIDRPAGNRRIYEVDRDGLARLRVDLDQYWSSALAAYKAAVEQPAREVP
jgi:DNA-binding transcriptional ArsR family regulator